MNTVLFLTIFSLFGLLYFILGMRASQKVTTQADYFIANKQLGVWQITSNLIATQLGGGMLLGTAASAYTMGYYGILYTLGMSLGFILLACGIASRLQQCNVITTAQLFETRYDSMFLQKIASVLSIATLFGILVAQVVGFKSLMAAIGFGSTALVVPFWLSVVAYTMIGGLRAITINDMVQLCIIIVTFGVVCIVTLLQEPISFFSWKSIVQPQSYFASEMLSYASLFSVIGMPALFSLIEQDLAQRFFAAKSKYVATVSACNAALFLLLFSIVPVYLGMKAKLTNIVINEGANPLLVFLKTTIPELLFIFVLCAIVAAIISTADALMNGISANITQDFQVARYVSYNPLRVSKATTFVVGLVALVASYYVPQNIIDILIGSYELSVSCLLVPLLFCYFKNKVSKTAAYWSIAAGFIGFIFFRIYPTVFPKELMSLGLSLGGYLLGSFLQGKKR